VVWWREQRDGVQAVMGWVASSRVQQRVEDHGLMASLIEAVIYDGATRPAALPPDVCTVLLPAGLMMLPVTDELAARLGEAAAGDPRIGGGWRLRPPVAALAREISEGRRVLYIVGETFGGPGIQEAAGWQDGRLWFGPSGTCDIEADLVPGYHLAARRDGAINTGLRALGVRAAAGQDEYQALGLDSHRDSNHWLEPPRGPSGHTPPADGMHVVFRLRRDFTITDAAQLLAAARAAYIELNPEATEHDAAQMVTSAADAIFTVLERDGLLGRAADAVLDAHASHGLQPGGWRAQVTTGEALRLGNGPDCLDRGDIFALPPDATRQK
jgi:hypothetical protein